MVANIDMDKGISADHCDGRLSEQQIRQWRDEGYLFVNGLIPVALIDALSASARERFPAPGSAEAASISDFGSGAH